MLCSLCVLLVRRLGMSWSSMTNIPESAATTIMPSSLLGLVEIRAIQVAVGRTAVLLRTLGGLHALLDRMESICDIVQSVGFARACMARLQYVNRGGHCCPYVHSHPHQPICARSSSCLLASLINTCVSAAFVCTDCPCRPAVSLVF